MIRFVSTSMLALLVGAASTCALAVAPSAVVSQSQQQVPGALQSVVHHALARDTGTFAWTESKVVASDGAANNQFGYSVSISGDTALIGAAMADSGQGAAYLFSKSNGVWTQVSRIAASDGAAGDNFGWSVSLSGSKALIGARAANSNRGVAYVFNGAGSSWTQAAKLVASDGAADDRFGNAVAIDGSTALISAVTASPNGVNWQGAGYVFTESGGTWTQAAKLVASDGAGNDQLGITVALEGDTAVMAAPLKSMFAGAAYVFTGPSWTQTQKIVAADAGPFSAFAASVSLQGSTMVLGANLAAGSVGAAYVFNKSGASWTQQQKLTISDGEPGFNFGVSVDIDGNALVIGADRANGANGAAYVFQNTAGNWAQSKKLAASDAQSQSGFGYTVSIDDGVVLVGAGQATVAGNAKQGAGYFYADDGVAGTPIANVSPLAGFEFTIDEGASASNPLLIGNTGTANLVWSIDESTAFDPNPPSYKTAAVARATQEGRRTASTLRSARAKGLNNSGRPLQLDATMISQMTDNSPGDEGLACTGDGTASTSDNSWWRRFYFSEHAQVGAAANITAVTISSSSATVPGGLPTTINLYTIAHSTAVDTIPTGALTLIGSTTTTVSGASASVTIPVTGSINDTEGKDLVVEWHTEGSAAGEFYPGANLSAQTHPTFISSNDCGIAEPTDAAEIGFPDFHLTMVVSVDDAAGPVGCENPSNVPWLSASPAAGTTAPGATSNALVTVNAGALSAGSYLANLCLTTNDPIHALITLPVSLTVAVAGPADGIFCSGFESGETGSCAPPASTDIVTGTVNQAVVEDGDGSTLDFVTGQWSSYNPGRVDDLNLYDYGDGTLTAYLYGDSQDLPVGAVVDAGGMIAVLQSGATVGPASTISADSGFLTNWLGGVNGYIGIAFTNEQTGVLNYGYLHLTTTGPMGFPAQALEYAYDKSGAAITIP